MEVASELAGIALAGPDLVLAGLGIVGDDRALVPAVVTIPVSEPHQLTQIRHNHALRAYWKDAKRCIEYINSENANRRLPPHAEGARVHMGNLSLFVSK